MNYLSLLNSMALAAGRTNQHISEREYDKALTPLTEVQRALKEVTTRLEPLSEADEAARIAANEEKVFTAIQLLSQKLTSPRDDEKITEARVSFLRCVYETIRFHNFIQGSTGKLPSELQNLLIEVSNSLVDFAQTVLLRVNPKTMYAFLEKSYSATSSQTWMDTFIGRERPRSWVNGAHALAKKLSSFLEAPCVIKEANVVE